MIESSIRHMLMSEKRIPKFRYPFSVDIVAADQKIRSFVHRGERVLERFMVENQLGESVVEVEEPELKVSLRRIITFESFRCWIFILKHFRRYRYIKSTARFMPQQLMETGGHEQLPIKTDNVASWYAGLMPYSVWFQPAANIPRKCDVSHVLDVDRKYDNQMLIGGSWETTQYHLQDMARKMERTLKLDQLLSVVSDVLDVLPDVTVYMPCKSHLNFIKVNPVSKPGMVSGIFSRDKGEASSWAVIAAKQIWDDVYSGRALFNPCVWSLSGRGRRHDWDPIPTWASREELFPQIDTRLVQVPEYPVHIVEAAFQRKLSYYLHNPKFHKDTWYSVGHSMTNMGWSVLHEFDRFGMGMEGDWKSFDSLFFKDLVYVSFAVLRSFFACEHICIDNFFTFFANSFINRLVVTPGDFIYNLTQGVPSGTIWTNDVDTIGNILVWMYIFKNYPGYKHLDPRSDIRVLAGGDDFLHAYRKPVTFDPEDLVSWVAWNVGWKIKDDYVFGPVWNRSCFNKSLSFFKTILDERGYPTRRLQEVVKSTNCPERRPKFSFDKFFSQAGFGPPPGEARIGLQKLFRLQFSAGASGMVGMEGFYNVSRANLLCGLLERECARIFKLSMLSCPDAVSSSNILSVVDNPLCRLIKESADAMAYLGRPDVVADYWLNWTWNSLLHPSSYNAPPWHTYNAKRDHVIKLRRKRRAERRKSKRLSFA